MVSGPIASRQIEGKNGSNDVIYFLEVQISLRKMTAAMKLKDAYSLEGML